MRDAATRIVYEFKETFRLGESPRTVCVAPQSLLEGYANKDDLASRFAGWIRYVEEPSGVEYLGVWGTRNASRFRTMLKSKGVDFVLDQNRPDSIKLSVRHVGVR